MGPQVQMIPIGKTDGASGVGRRGLAPGDGELGNHASPRDANYLMIR